MNTIIYNAKIYPQSTDNIYSVLAIKDDKICYVGNSLDEAEEMLDGNIELYNALGKAVIPSFIDSHTHPTAVSLTDWHVIKKCSNVTDLLSELKAYCEEHPVSEVPYLYCDSFELTWFDEKGPNKRLLDEYISDRPVRIQDFTDHSYWYNSKALELLGIDRNTPDPDCIPPNAFIVRDETGDPTGWIKEITYDALDVLLYKAIGWEPERHPTEKNMKPFLDFLHKSGVTTVMDAHVSESTLDVMKSLDDKGELPFHFDGCVCLDNPDEIEETIRRTFEIKEKYETRHIHIHTVKFFLDGTNELGDMGSLYPLLTDPTGTDYGHMNMNTEQLTRVMIRLNEAGLDFHMHIVGDRAFRASCDAMENAKKHCGDSWRIQVTSAHCELTAKEDRKRPSELGMFINWSCHWAGGYFGEKSIDYLGRERFDTMYDFTEMDALGTKLAFSSDVFSYKEANRANPFFGIQVSATRIDPEFPLNPERFPDSVRTPKEAILPVKTLIKGYTLTAAEQLRLNDTTGSIDTGKDANLIVLSENPFEIEPGRISEIYPVALWFEGKHMY